MIRAGSTLMEGERFVGIHRYITDDYRITDEMLNRFEAIVGDMEGSGDVSLWILAFDCLVNDRPAYWTLGFDEADRTMVRIANKLSLKIAACLFEGPLRFKMLSDILPLNNLAIVELDSAIRECEESNPTSGQEIQCDAG